MQRLFIIIPTILSLALSGFFSSTLEAAEGTPEIIVEIERNRIYEGESVLYRVTLNHVEYPREPILKALDDFTIAPLGQQSLDQQSIIIINGRRSESIRRGRQYNYRLTPKRAGEFTLPGPTAEVDGQTLRGRDVSLTVIAPQDQDAVRMEIAAEPAAVYPMQPFTITLSIAVKAMPESLADENPVAVQSNPPALGIPWVEDKKLPEGLTPQADLAHWLGPLENDRGWGFSINDIGSASIIAMFQERKIAFMPKPEKIRLPDKSGREASYWRFKFARTFVPKRIEDFTFGPVTLKGLFAAKVDANRGVLGENIYAVAKAITVNVKDVPRDGRPGSYIGAVGQFRLSAELTPHKVKTGDPMTLMLTLRGEGTLDSATAPDLSKNPAIAKNFKIYDATEQTKGNERRFTYSLRPLTALLTEFPPVEASYFDVRKEQFDTLCTDPMPIEITAADKLAGREIVSAPNGSSGNGKELEIRREGIYANVADPAQLTNQSIRPVAWAACWGTMLGGYGLLALGVARVRRRSGDTARLRRASAPKHARQSLKKGLRDLAAGRDREGAESIEDALLNLVADWTDSPAAGMTAADACRLLESIAVPAEVITAVKNIVESSESLRFGGTRQAVELLRKEAEPALERLIVALRKAKRGAV